MLHGSQSKLWVGLLLAYAASGASLGQSQRDYTLAFARYAQEDRDEFAARSMPTAPEEGKSLSEGLDYHEVSKFFNIREANPDVHKGEWEFEVQAEWNTNSDSTDDDITNSFALKYGLTEDLFLELELLPINYGDGADQGNGDLSLAAFYRLLREDGALPALATWAEIRIPSGQGSSGVDGELHLNVTKTILPKFRVHFEGFILTANGAPGGNDEDRRDFQWGVGPGIDYLLDDHTLLLANYLNRSSELNGVGNQNLLEIGAVHEIVKDQQIKAAVDIGLDDNEGTPNFAVKLEYAIEWH